MMSGGWIFILYDWCPYKKGKFDTEIDMHKGKMRSHRLKIAIYKPKREELADICLPALTKKQP